LRITLTGLAIAGVMSAPALAAPTTVALGGASFADAPVSYDFGGGNSITFTTVAPGSFAPAGVSTSGNLQVASLGAPFYDPPQPTAYFTNRGGSFGPGVLAQFVGYTTPATVPFSIVQGLVGFRFDLGQGLQYGYADITGSTFSGVRFETTAGADVAFGAVPEPATWMLLIGGMAGVGMAMRRKRSALLNNL